MVSGRIVRQRRMAQVAVTELLLMQAKDLRELRRYVLLKLYRDGRRPTRGKRPGSYRAFGKPTRITVTEDPARMVRYFIAEWDRAVALWRTW